MMATRWRRVKTIVGGALELPAGKRTAYIAEACGDDTSVMHEVEQLLAQEVGAEVFEEPVTIERHALTNSWIGRQLGAYLISEEMPRGGMGRIFKATRNDGQYKSGVVIKTLHWNVDTPELRRRFVFERQILAQLNHPNIARIIDGGELDGLPYFVMEFVDGLPIDKYCSKHKLDIHVRLEIFIAVCHAVEAAHRQLIVHRDLKPENILIQEGGVPKLLDFGIAKLLSEQSNVTSSHTNLSGIAAPFTPGYAAPEQFKGQPVTTATDVYALGCVLYRILTGTLPFNEASGNNLALMHAVCEKLPKRPSEVVSTLDPENMNAILDGMPKPDMMVGKLRGDLDVIITKAISIVPDQRYGTVAEMRADIRRYLRGWPIAARPPSFHYYAVKFIQRNSAVVAATALAILMASAGIVGVIWKERTAETIRLRAEGRLHDVQILTEKLIFDYNDKINELPGALPVSKKLMADAATFLDQLSNDESLSPNMRADLAAAYLRLSEVQGGFEHSNLGEVEAAQSNRLKAYKITKDLLITDPINPRLLGIMLDALGMLEDESVRVSDFIADKRYGEEAVDLSHRFMKSYPESHDAALEYCNALNGLGTHFSDREGNYDKGIDLARQAQEVEISVLKQEPTNFRAINLFANSLTAEGLYLIDGHSDSIGARKLFKRAMEQERFMTKLQPENVLARSELASSLFRMASIDRDRGEISSAISYFQEEQSVLNQMMSLSHQDLYLEYLNATVSNGLIDCYLSIKDGQKARLNFNNLFATSQKLSRADPKSYDYIYLAVTADIARAKINVMDGDLIAASASFKTGSMRLQELALKDSGTAIRLLKMQRRYIQILADFGYRNRAIDALKAQIEYINTYMQYSPEVILHEQSTTMYRIANLYEAEAIGLKGGRLTNALENSRHYYELAKKNLDQLVDKHLANPVEIKLSQEISNKLSLFK